MALSLIIFFSGQKKTRKKKFTKSYWHIETGSLNLNTLKVRKKKRSTEQAFTEELKNKAYFTQYPHYKGTICWNNNF